MLTVFPIEKQKFSPNKTLVSNLKLLFPLGETFVFPKRNSLFS